MFRFISDQEWVDQRLKGLPAKWAHRLRRAWESRHPTDHYSANVELREATADLQRVRIPLDASDHQVCEAAKLLADRCFGRTTIALDSAYTRQALERICTAQGITPPPPTMDDGPAIARMCCVHWWRRKLRRHQGQTVEGWAIRLGYVNRTGALYVSDERLAARRQQNRRNAAILETTFATNELGETFTLADLAAKSTANKAIRRAELMTRIAGFERYALKAGHEGLFLTITCPSRFHRHTTVNGGQTVIPNPRFDRRESPRTGHLYLCRLWARIRAKLARLNVRPYGFRIAEPQHDGTPHWHLLLFCPPDQVSLLVDTMHEHALRDTPDEPGAAEHRFDFKRIDHTKGSAAGYVAKYVAKNIDGQHVGSDLEGRPATESAERVEAWANTWRIRQFQQIGGPPVGVWRELRRIRSLPHGAPDHLVRAHRAASKRTEGEEGEARSAAWDEYCRAQGGTGCGRKAAIRLAIRPASASSRYGDTAAPRPFGVMTTAFLPGATEGEGPTQRAWVVESVRHAWTVAAATRRFQWADQRVEWPRAAQPRTRVNNCTANQGAFGSRRQPLLRSTQREGKDESALPAMCPCETKRSSKPARNGA